MNGELRIKDEDLGVRLGFNRPRDIRKIIVRYLPELGRMGVCATASQTSGSKGGRPTEAYYLNRKQAIFITAKSETAISTDITIEIVERFDAYERGEQPVPNHLSAREVGGIVKSVVTKMKSDLLAELKAEIREKLTPAQRELSEHAVAVVQEKVAEKQALVETRVPGQIAAFPIPANLIPKRRPNTGTCRLPVGEIGRRLGIGAAKVNAMLADLGLQSAGTTNQPWMVTDNGEFFGVQPTKRVILWSARTLDVLRWRMEARPFAKAPEKMGA
ncbi:hypothetical protein D3W54_14810 [Komagataeibacter medellinensis]|uniref:Antirepressor protein C-terminal domain-containing protein n=2 Tax=Komagataeibacter medellinensis TaxID=1177712 RepID=A0ABQ6VR87_9PROT|nr:hypothetical protein D3W54_14810 [Komagataeibacter medellinensis]